MSDNENPHNDFSLRKFTFVPDFPFVVWSLGLTTLIVILYIFGGGILALFMGNDTESSTLGYINSLAEIFLMMLPAILLARVNPLGIKELFRLNRMPTNKQLFFAIVGLVSFQLFVGSYSVIQEALIPDIFLDEYLELKTQIEEMYLSFLSGHGLLALFRGLLVGAIVPAISEEFVFPGFLQRSLEEKMNYVPAVIIAGTFFGIIHFNPIDVLPLILIGIYLGLLAYYSRSILLPIIIHFLNNSFAIIALNYSSVHQLEDSTQNMSLGEAIPICLTGFVMTSVIIFLIRKNRTED